MTTDRHPHDNCREAEDQIGEVGPPPCAACGQQHETFGECMRETTRPDALQRAWLGPVDSLHPANHGPYHVYYSSPECRNESPSRYLAVWIDRDGDIIPAIGGRHAQR